MIFGDNIAHTSMLTEWIITGDLQNVYVFSALLLKVQALLS